MVGFRQSVIREQHLIPCISGEALLKTCLVASDFFTFIRSLWYLGVMDERPSRRLYWRLLKDVFSRYRECLADMVTVAIYGYHFRKLFWSRELSDNWEEWCEQASGK